MEDVQLKKKSYRVAYLKCAPCEEVGSWVPSRGLGFLRACYQVPWVFGFFASPASALQQGCEVLFRFSWSWLNSADCSGWPGGQCSISQVSSGFHLLCFKVSAPGISFFNLQLKAKFQKKSQRRRKRTLPPEQIKILKWVVLRNWDMTGSCCVEVDNQQSHFLSMACSAGALGASTVRIRMQRGNVQNLR